MVFTVPVAMLRDVARIAASGGNFGSPQCVIGVETREYAPGVKGQDISFFPCLLNYDR